MPSRALEHLRAHRGVGAGVAEHVRLNRSQVTFGVAADFVAHADWMALRMNPNRFLTVEREPHRAARHLGQKARVRLDRHVLLAAERAAVRDELDVEIRFRHAEKRRHLALVVEDSLALAVEAKAPRSLAGLDEGALGFEVEVLDALSDPLSLDDMSALAEGALDISPANHAMREGVRVLRIHLWGAVGDGVLRIQDGIEHFILNVDEGRRLARRVLVLRGDCRQEVADAADFFAFGDEARPVLRDQAVPALARDVHSGSDSHDAGVRPGAGGVDAQHPRSGVAREDDGSEEHALAGKVGDVRPAPEGELSPLVAAEAGAYTPVFPNLGVAFAAHGAPHQLDRVEHLGVARAAAQVDVDRLRDFGARRFRVLLQEMPRLHRNSGDAEAALEASRGHERVGRQLALRFGDPLESQDLLARSLGNRHRAGDDGSFSHEGEAAPALTLWRAAVLDRSDSAAFAKCLEQGLASARNELGRLPVDRQARRLAGVHGEGVYSMPAEPARSGADRVLLTPPATAGSMQRPADGLGLED